jgi:hypothetical protein
MTIFTPLCFYKINPSGCILHHYSKHTENVLSLFQLNPLPDGPCSGSCSVGDPASPSLILPYPYPLKSLLTLDRPRSSSSSSPSSVFLRLLLTAPFPFPPLSSSASASGLRTSRVAVSATNRIPMAVTNTALGYVATVPLYIRPNRRGYMWNKIKIRLAPIS